MALGVVPMDRIACVTYVEAALLIEGHAPAGRETASLQRNERVQERSRRAVVAIDALRKTTINVEIPVRAEDQLVRSPSGDATALRRHRFKLRDEGRPGLAGGGQWAAGRGGRRALVAQNSVGATTDIET